MPDVRLGLAVTTTITAVLAGVAAARGPSLLDEVRAGNTAAIQSIASFHCKVTAIHSPSSPLLESSAEHWRSPDAARYRCKFNGLDFDVACRDGRVRSIQRSSSKRDVDCSVTADDNDQRGSLDPWGRGLLTFHHPTGFSRVSFDEFILHAPPVRTVERRIVDGRPVVVVEVPVDKYELEFAFDPAVNYLVRKYTTRRGGRVSSVAEVKRFREVVPTVFFPESIFSQRFADDGSVEYSAETTFTAIEINKPLQPDTFDLPFPPGAEVLDSIEGVKYTIGPDGNRIGATTPLSRSQPMPSSAPPRTETLAEPQPGGRWLLPVSAAILALAGSLVVYRRWRAKSPRPAD